MSWKFWKKDDDNEVKDASAVANNTKTVSSDEGKKDEKKKKGFGAKMKDAAVKKMMEKQLKNLPPAQREVVMNAITNNPEFFEKIAKEIEVETKNGASQMAASMKVMRKHQGELQKVMMGSK